MSVQISIMALLAIGATVLLIRLFAREDYDFTLWISMLAFSAVTVGLFCNLCMVGYDPGQARWIVGLGLSVPVVTFLLIWLALGMDPAARPWRTLLTFMGLALTVFSVLLFG